MIDEELLLLLTRETGCILCASERKYILEIRRYMNRFIIIINTTESVLLNITHRIANRFLGLVELHIISKFNLWRCSRKVILHEITRI